MKVWKLVSGILNIVLFVLVTFQSCATGLGNTPSDNDEVSGSTGVIVAVMLLAGGIVSIATRKKYKKGREISNLQKMNAKTLKFQMGLAERLAEPIF